jgi:acetyltransferase-like isoleucine patch superfamily enzyme
VIPTETDDTAVPAERARKPLGLRTALFWSLLTIWLPWALRRRLLNLICGYSIAPGSRIGFSVVACPGLHMEPGARIGHFNVIKGARLEMRECASIGDFNWIAGLPLESARHFVSEIGRDPALCLGRHAGLTSRHFLDCSNRIDIGEFATIAGARSQILTHAIDLRANKQVSAPVSIGRYCFVGTGCVVLKGARLPECSVLAAGSSLARAHDETFTLYSGVPAMPVKALPRESAYFSRVRGFVD